MWLKRSDDLLATAWGSMDRYHLAWLMVGKPKGIVRGRPMTPDEEAAYVREVAEQKTAALRMSLDAVERQGMPFVGESGGVGPGERSGPAADTGRPTAGPRARPRGPAGRPGHDRASGRGTAPGRGAPRPRCAACAAPGEDAAMTGRGSDATGRATGTDLVPAVGGTRMVPAPDPVARDYILLALRLEQHIPGLVDGYFGPADLKATVDMEQLRSPARLRDDATALRDRLAAEVADPDRRAWLDAQLVALETQAGGLAGETLPYLDYVARCFAYTPPRYPDERVRGGRGADRRSCFPGTLRWRIGSKPGTPASSCRSIDCRAWWTGSSPASATRRPPISASPTARTCGSRS